VKSKTQEKISENKKSQKPAGDTPGDTLWESLLRRYVAGRIHAAVHGDPAVSSLVFHKHRSYAGPAWNAIDERKLLYSMLEEARAAAIRLPGAV